MKVTKLILLFFAFTNLPQCALRKPTNEAPPRSFEKVFYGAELQSKEKFKYGRFSVRMRPPAVEGMISSFFLFEYFDVYEENRYYREVDFEFLGKNPSKVQTNIFTGFREMEEETFQLPFNTSEQYVIYEIEWKPEEIIWKVKGKVLRRFNHAETFNQPMRVVLNTWVSAYEPWAGKVDIDNWRDSEGEIDWIRYQRFDENSGDFEITHRLIEEFSQSDLTSRWTLSSHTFENWNITIFNPENVQSGIYNRYGNSIVKLKVSKITSVL